jgi:prepilin-type N-terminal cleavage/methylation domain-containing protein
MVSSSRPRGYTLTELLTVLAVLGILTLAGIALLLGQRAFLLTETSAAHNQADAAVALAAIAETMKTADRVESSHAFTVNGTPGTYTTGLHTLALRLPAISAAGVPLQNAFDYILIARDPSAAKRILTVTDPAASSARPATQRALIGTATVLNFLYDANPASSATVVTATVGTASEYGGSLARNAPSQIAIRLRNL